MEQVWDESRNCPKFQCFGESTQRKVSNAGEPQKNISLTTGTGACEGRRVNHSR
jgi:hypothetical protein